MRRRGVVHLDRGKQEFRFSVNSDGEDIQAHNENPDDGNPSSRSDLSRCRERVSTLYTLQSQQAEEQGDSSVGGER